MIGLLLIIAVSAQTDTSGAGTGPSQLQDQSEEEGWYLQGEPVITKDQEIDLPPCYADRTVTVSNGKGHGSQMYSAECFKERSGTFSSDVTWTIPPTYLKPGSIIDFSMTCTSPFDDIPTGGGIKADGETILEGRSTNPDGESMATYTVPDGSPGDELEVYTSFIVISGLHGYVTYNYKYQGAAELSPVTQPADVTVPLPEPESPEPPDLKIDSEDIYFFNFVGEKRNELQYERSADNQSIQVKVQNNGKVEANSVKVQFYIHRDDADTPLGDPIEISSIPPEGGKAYGSTYWDLKGQNIEDATIVAEAYIPGQDDANEMDNRAATTVNILYAHNGDRAFNWFDDTYSFENYDFSGRETEEMVEGLLATVIGNMQGPRDSIPLLQRLFFPQTFIRFLNYTQKSMKFGAGGHCYGMSATSGLYFQDSSLRPVPKPTKDMSQEEASTNINLYHHAQMVPLWESMLTNRTFSAREESPAKCYQAIKDSLKNSREPIIVQFFGKEHNITVGHAVLAYKLIEVGEKDPYVYVYDSNFPESNVDQSDPMPGIHLRPAAATWGTWSFMGYDWAYPEWISAHKVFREIPLDLVNAIVPELKKDLHAAIEGMKWAQLFNVAIRCPADAIFTDRQGRRIGTLNGALINEIPGAEILSEGEVEIYQLPLDREYSLLIAGTGSGELDFDIIRPEGENSVRLISFQNVPVKSGTKITGSLDTGVTIQAIRSGSRIIQPTLNGTVDLTGLALISPEATEGERESISRDDHPSNVIYNSWNLGSVDNAPTCSPFFTISEPQMITYIDTYHLNFGQGAPGGTISLSGGDGTLYGPWVAETSQDGGDVPNGYWIVHPKEVIPAGSYTIEDSDPDTWSKNSESPCGMAKVEGYAVESSASRERGVPAAGKKDTGSSAAPPKKRGTYTASGMAEPAVQSSQERGSVAQEEIADAGTNSYATDKATSYTAKEDLAAAGPEPVLMGESAYAAASAPSIEIRGQVARGDFEWTAKNFAGFYYDPKNDVGTEVLTATLTDGKLSKSQPFGLYYQTNAQRQDFDFQDWGSYLVLGFLGEKHFAGYVEGSDSENGYLFDKSGDRSALAKGELLKVLEDGLGGVGGRRPSPQTHHSS